MSTDRKVALELLRDIAKRIDDRLARHTVAEEAGSPSGTPMLTRDLIAFRDEIGLVTGELLAAPAAAQVRTVLDRITGVDYGTQGHSLPELVDVSRKLAKLIATLQEIVNRSER